MTFGQIVEVLVDDTDRMAGESASASYNANRRGAVDDWYRARVAHQTLGVDHIDVQASVRKGHRERVLGEAIARKETRCAEARGGKVVRELLQRVRPNRFGAAARNAPARQVQ